jgi:hypothetical protein
MDVKFNEDNVPVEVNGKKVMKSYQNAYRKASNTDYFVSYRHLNPVEVRGIVLNTLEASIYKWTMDWYKRYSYAVDHAIFPITKVTKAPVTTYDDMRYFLNSINPNTWELID